MKTRPPRRWVICLVLAAATAALYWRVAGYEFVNFDDPELVSENPRVLGGPTADRANVISANLAVGMVGVYEVRLSLGLGTPPSPLTQLTISQNIYTSNIVTIPVIDPTVQTPVPTTP